MTAAKKIDSKGRLLLGEKFAGSIVIVEERENGELVIKPAIVIPAHEKWLFDNPAALNSVLVGLKQAREGKFVTSPSFNKKKPWKDKLED